MYHRFGLILGSTPKARVSKGEAERRRIDFCASPELRRFAKRLFGHPWLGPFVFDGTEFVAARETASTAATMPA